MTVFRGYLRGALRQRAVIFLYLAIFFGLGTFMTLSMDEDSTGNYEPQSLTMAVIGAVFYGVSVLMTAAMNPSGILEEPNRGWYLLNILTMVVVGQAIAFLVVHAAGSANGVNGLANVIALGMSFLCGVFIPDAMLSAQVKRLARFLPVYWYEQNNTTLGTHTALSEFMRKSLMRRYERQLIFAAAVLIAALAVRRIRGLRQA